MLETATANAPIAPLSLLLRVNLLSSWRRLKSVREQSRLLTTVISLFIGSYLVVAFWLFLVGLRFLARFPGFGTFLMERLLFLLFAFLFMLLLISNLVISYTNLFRNRETTFLLTMPVPTQTIFRWKFIESTLLASWAFLFLIAPLLGAYGLIQNVMWHFYPMTLLLVGLFIVLPAVAGSYLAINIARFLDRRLFQVCALVVMAGIICVAAFWLRPEPTSADSETRVAAVLDKMLMRTRFSQYPWLPSYWVSFSVLNWASGAVAVSGFFLLVLLSHVLFFGMLSFTRTGNLFYDATSAVNSRGKIFAGWKWDRTTAVPLKRSRRLLESVINRLTCIEPDVRALIVKDTRMFWRDTTQWAQSLMLFGLLAVYIFNLRHFSQQLSHAFWVHLVSYLNLGACSLNLATLTTRFVYPQFSLEGKRLWIVGMAPLGMVRVVKTKFWLATWTSLMVTISLIWLSCYMLEMQWERIVYFAVVVTVMTFTLTGLAVGLGTLYPNFKEENPSKIVSGFGGTFCLVLSFLYILGSVVLLAFASPWSVISSPSAWQIAGAIAGFFALSVLLGWLPLRLGFKRLEQFEL
jgi:ABC-2 type transport system permease protein